MKARFLLLAGACAASAFSLAQQPMQVVGPTLGVGDKAPKITIAEFVKGDKVPATLKKDHVYVVEFWATWCGPCIDAFPHLSELQKKHKGKATFIGVNAFEQVEGPDDVSYYSNVRDFVKDQGERMDYTVAIDKGGKTAEDWMIAAGQNGIPAAFIVDKNSQIAWIGHPMNMDEPLEKIIAGDWDVEAFKREQAAEMEAMREEMMRQQAIGQAVGRNQDKVEAMVEKLNAGDTEGALKIMEELSAAEPVLKEEFVPLRIEGLLELGKPEAYTLIKERSNDPRFKDDALMLNNLAWTIIDPDANVVHRDDKLALDLAERAVKLSESKDANILDTLALAQYRNKKYDDAVKSQTKALEIAKANPQMYDPESIAEFEQRLMKFRAAAKDGGGYLS